MRATGNCSQFVWMALALTLTACGGPTLIFPGGALEGEVSSAPQDWSSTDAIDTIQLETRPSEPYSVNIWVIANGPALYVHAGANRAEWVKHMEADSSVRIRIENRIYLLQAERVTDAGEFAAFADKYEAKYDRRPRNENVNEAYLFRLTPAA